MTMLAFAAWLAAFLPTSSAFVLPPSTTKLYAPSLIQNSSFKHTSSIKLSNALTSSDPEHYNFMKSVECRLEDLERDAPEILSDFYEPHLKSFSVRPGSVQDISVTSTCFALLTIFATGDCSLFSNKVDLNMKSQFDAMDGEKKLSKIPIRAVVKALLRTRWREDDMFQVPLILYTVLKIDQDRSILNSEMDEELCHRVNQLIAATIDNRPKRRTGISQPLSDYILYLITDSLAALVESTPTNIDGTEDIGLGGLPSSALPEGAASTALLALTRCVEVSYNELCRQLAFRTAGDRTSFDVIQLAYSLLTYIKASNAMAGTAGREVTKGGGPVSGTAVQPPNRRLVAAALTAFFEEQNADGTWDQGQPIYKSFRKTGRDVGNAFVFVADTVGSLLGALPAEDFLPHLAGLNRLLSWIEHHQIVEIIPDYCDPETSQCYGKPLRGWASPHMTAQLSSPVAWFTAQTLTCVMRMRKVVQRLLHIDALKEFGGKTNPLPKLASWDRLLDTDLGNPTDGITLKSVLDERMIRPFSDTIQVTGSACVPKVGLAYSAILFGPPGTAKSTICEALAERMGWDFVVIDTANFLEDGLTNVASRIRYVFDRLESLTNCVILFDEIEEFCLDRETPGLGMESRLLTTSMLTQINDLRRAKKSIFFLATNRLRAFDSAIIRPGRFDMQLFVGTPNLESRVIQLRSQLDAVPVSQHIKDEAEESFRLFLTSVWDDDAMFFNYLEGLQLASACADVVRAGNPLSEDRMSTILTAQAVVMTVRGQVREEYRASMGLSRL
ncbi:hypothetical protein ACHAXR_012169 [Thalassiosira sp. AJA248-18]